MEREDINRIKVMIETTDYCIEILANKYKDSKAWQDMNCEVSAELDSALFELNKCIEKLNDTAN